MAFVDDDEIEEIARILSVEAGTVLATREALLRKSPEVRSILSQDGPILRAA
jgi:hypothetical protein